MRGVMRYFFVKSIFSLLINFEHYVLLSGRFRNGMIPVSTF